jgi:hypothetical protein
MSKLLTVIRLLRSDVRIQYSVAAVVPTWRAESAGEGGLAGAAPEGTRDPAV